MDQQKILLFRARNLDLVQSNANSLTPLRLTFMISQIRSRRIHLQMVCLVVAGTAALSARLPFLRADEDRGPLLAYVGTFSSPLRDMLPTQVDLPPGNGRGIHIFRVNRATGAMTAAGTYEMGTSPSCLTIDRDGTRLYSTNETDRVGQGNQGTVSAFSIDPQSGELTLLNTVRSGGAGPTYASIHPTASFLFVANYFGGSISVLPIQSKRKFGRSHRHSN
jgi:6-phosphogluconolactonase